MDGSLDALIRAALDEDCAENDITTLATVPEGARCTAQLLAKQRGVLSGIEVFAQVFAAVDPEITLTDTKVDGDTFKEGDTVATIEGPTRGILTAERTALNFLQRLSGVATHTAAIVKQVSDLKCGISDTRKTTPLLRALEKAAVVHGGGQNHRASLAESFLIKENHIAAAGGIGAAVAQARAFDSEKTVEVEVTTLTEFHEALAAEPDVIMLDNMDLESMEEAVRLARTHNGRASARKVRIEASGNANSESVRDMAEAGVDYISVGALTHSAPAVDFSLLIEPVE